MAAVAARRHALAGGGKGAGGPARPPARPSQHPAPAAQSRAVSPPAGGHPGTCVLLAATALGPGTGAHLLTLPHPPPPCS